MERNVTRINGVKSHLHEWTDEDVLRGIENTRERSYAALMESTQLLGEAAARGLVAPIEEPSEPPEVA